MPYVVRLHNCQILAEPQKVFHFHHPNKGKHRRVCSLAMGLLGSEVSATVLPERVLTLTVSTECHFSMFMHA